MAFKVSMEVRGLDTLLTRLRGLRASTQRRILRPAVTAAGTPVLKRARQLVPRDTGLLKRALAKKVRTDPQRNRVVCIVGVQRKKFRKLVARKSRYSDKPYWNDPAHYVHLVELGTLPHALGKGSKRERRRLGRGVGWHPGAVARPFLRPALEQTRAEVERILRERISAGILKHAHRG